MIIIIARTNWTIVTKIIAGINVEIQIICPLGAVTECGQNIPPCSIMGNI